MNLPKRKVELVEFLRSGLSFYGDIFVIELANEILRLQGNVPHISRVGGTLNLYQIQDVVQGDKIDGDKIGDVNVEDSKGVSVGREARSEVDDT